MRFLQVKGKIVLFFIIIVIIFFLSGCTFINQTPNQAPSQIINNFSSITEYDIIFNVKVGNLALQARQIANGLTFNDTISTTLSGILYNQPKIVQNINKELVDRSTPESTMASIFSANKIGDADWIAENFIENEQAATTELISKEGLLERNTKLFNDIQNTEIAGYVNYNQYVILLIRYNKNDGTTLSQVIPLKKSGEEWKASNALTSDETFDIISSAWRSGEVRKK